MPLVTVGYDPDFITSRELTQLSQSLPDIVAARIPGEPRLTRREIEVQFRPRGPHDQHHPRLGIQIIANYSQIRETYLDASWKDICDDIRTKTGIDLPLEKGGRIRSLFEQDCYVWIMLVNARFGIIPAK